MKYYPVCLRVAGRSCVVIGGGNVAEQRVESLLSAGARVTLVAPALTPQLSSRTTSGQVAHRARTYTRGDLVGFFLACAATDDPQVQENVTAEARDAGVLLNVVDRPELCDFIMPAVTQRGDLIVATSTSGTSPALARRIRRQLDRTFGPEYAVALRLLGRVRAHLRSARYNPAERRRILTTLAESPLLDHLRAGRRDRVDALLAATVGGGVSLASLGMELDGR